MEGKEEFNSEFAKLKEKFNKLKEPFYSKQFNVSMGISVVLLLIYFAIAVPCLWPIKDINVHWLVFGFLALFIPCANRLMQVYRIQLGISSKTFFYSFKLVVLMELWDLFYMAHFANFYECIFAFGILIILIELIGISKLFTNDMQKGLRWILPLELIIAVGLTIYLIYKIELPELQKITTAVIAAVYGGLITLTGVVLTINHGDKQRKEDKKQLELDRKAEEKKKAKPIFTCTFESDLNLKDNDIVCGISNPSGCVAPDKQIVCMAHLLNSDNSNFEIAGFYYDAWYEVDFNKYVLKNQKIKLIFMTDKFVDEWDNPYCYMAVKDMLGNYYYYKLKYKNSLSKVDRMNIVESIEEISAEEIKNLV